MKSLSQNPSDPDFAQNPWDFYARARETGPLFYWEDYATPMALSQAAVTAILRDRRFGREELPETRSPQPAHLAPFYEIEAHSMLELEPPRHTRLRGLVLRAFTSRRIAAMGPEIAAIAGELAEALPEGETFDLLEQFARPIPVRVIVRLMGLPESMAPQVLRWSQDMVALYQAGRTRETEDRAVAAALEFSDFLRGYARERRASPADDLITHLLAAEENGARLSMDELISTCILLLNAGDEATAHAMGNGLHALIRHKAPQGPWLGADKIAGTVEEILRWDPPLHLFFRQAYEDVEVMGHQIRRGERIGCLLGAANRDPRHYDAPEKFRPGRPPQGQNTFGAGLHFCLGAPLARLELQTALPVLFARHPGLRLKGRPKYANSYHFRGFARLPATTR